MNPTSLDDNIIYQLGEFSQEFSNAMSRNFKAEGHDVTPEQFGVLAVLWYQEGITQKELSEQIGRDKTTISRVVSSMIRKGLLDRTTHDSDRRSRMLMLTEKGRSLQQELIRISGEMFVKSMNGISESSIKIALYVVSKMRKNIK